MIGNIKTKCCSMIRLDLLQNHFLNRDSLGTGLKKLIVQVAQF